MHRSLLFAVATVCWVGFSSPLQADNSPPDPKPKDARELLRAGLFEEEANRDLGKAAADYAAVVEQYDAGRPVAATAIFRLAEIRNKQGNKAESITLYQRVLAEFPGDDALAKPSRERLAALGVTAPDAVITAGKAGDLAHNQMLVQAGLAPVPANSPAITADEAEDLVRVQELVKNSPDLLNAVAGEGSPSAGYTPLAYAAEKGWVQAATFLLDHGAKANGPTDGGEPLHLAAANGHKALVELLLAKGADLNAATPDGWTALHAACFLRRTEISRLLLDKKAKADVIFHESPLSGGDSLHHGWGQSAANDSSGQLHFPDATPLLIALQNEDDTLANLLLDHGANPNLYASSSFGVQNRFTDDSSPLIIAVSFRQEALAKRLLACGAKADFVTKGGRTALSAASSSAPDFVPFLLNLGVPQVPDRDGKPPLFWSLYFFNGSRVAHDFVNPGSLLSVPDFAGKYTKYLTAWNALLSHGANLEAQDKDGKTVFFFAVPDENSNSVQVADWLLAHGANLNARDHQQRTPLHLACDRNASHEVQVPTLAWLVEHGANLNARDENGNTPLHLCCQHWNDSPKPALRSVVAFLVARGADLDARNSHGDTSFQQIGDGDFRKQMEREFYYPSVTPKLTQERAVTAFFNYNSISPSRTLRITPAADFDAPPTLLGLLRQSTGLQSGENWGYPVPADQMTLSIHRATSKGADTEVARLPLDLKAGGIDVSKWPTLRWGDVVVFTSEEASSSDERWIEPALPTLRRTVTVQAGEHTAKLALADPAARLPFPGTRMVNDSNLQPARGWSSELSSLPDWTLAELLFHLTDAEPRAQLDAVRVERTVDGKTQAWTVDARATGPADALPGLDDQPSRIKQSAARLADGDRLIIPLLPADNAPALAARREFIGFAAPGAVFAEQIFTRRRSAPGSHTLSELVTQAYAGPLIVPYPDLSRVTIHRLKGDTGEEENVTIDFTAIVNQYTDALKAMPPPPDSRVTARKLDVPLQWGDVVEFASIDHTDPTRWKGLGPDTTTFLSDAGNYRVSCKVDGVPVSAVYLQTPNLDSHSSWSDSPEGYPAFHVPGRRELSEPLTALDFLHTIHVDQRNVASFVVQVGKVKREYDIGQLVETNPWITKDCQLFIRKLSP